jgi:hypothetical protein
MKIAQLLQAVSESKLNELDISPTGDPTVDKLRAKFAQDDAAAAAKASADQDDAVLRQQQAAKQQQGAASTTAQQPAPAGSTGDPVLDQPLNPAAPKKPGTTFAQKVGSLAKGVGAIGGGVAGIGRAVKKGYAAGANAVGGPGAPTSVGTTAPGAATNTPQPDQSDEIAQLRSQLQVMQQKLTRAGINENQKKGN